MPQLKLNKLNRLVNFVGGPFEAIAIVGSLSLIVGVVVLGGALWLIKDFVQ